MISIIIPSYGQKQYLKEAIESALNQTVPCEVIVVDDGSTDGSLEIAQFYVPEIKLITQVNKGLASARNTGIMNAHEEWVLPLDADDILEPNCAERILEIAQTTDAEIIAPSIKTFGLAEQVTTLMQNPVLEDFKIGNRISYCSAVRRLTLLEVGGYSSRMVWGAEDLHLWINLLTRGKKIVTIPEPLMKYRLKENSMWKETEKHKAEFMAQIYKDFPSFK